MSAGIMTGPYDIPVYHARAVTVATNKSPLGPYRGVGRSGACFAIETLIDAVARAVEREPAEVRIENMVPPAAMPYRSATHKLYDSGDYPEAARRAAAAIGIAAVRERQRRGEPDGRLIGVGLASYTEQTAHGTAEWVARGLPVVFGYEPALARFTPDGKLVLFVGIQNHGQGLETTLAQVAHQELGVAVADVVVRHGDSAVSPYGMGTFASRSMTMAGGAVSRACAELAQKIKRIGAHLLQAPREAVTLYGGRVHFGAQSVSFQDVAQAAYLHPERLPEGEEPALEASAVYQPERSTGAFSYATHACAVAVDPGTGIVEILDYVACHDCGTMVNPLIVEAQVVGGIAQGIGTALYEESPYDSSGQPLATTFLDYMIPGATEVPDVRVIHMETPSPHTRFGIKGMGEGGAIAPPAAVVNAINDALRPLGAEINETPATPERRAGGDHRGAEGLADEAGAVRLSSRPLARGCGGRAGALRRQRPGARRRPVAGADAQPPPRAGGHDRRPRPPRRPEDRAGDRVVGALRRAAAACRLRGTARARRQQRLDGARCEPDCISCGAHPRHHRRRAGARRSGRRLAHHHDRARGRHRARRSRRAPHAAGRDLHHRPVQHRAADGRADRGRGGAATARLRALGTLQDRAQDRRVRGLDGDRVDRPCTRHGARRPGRGRRRADRAGAHGRRRARRHGVARDRANRARRQRAPLSARRSSSCTATSSCAQSGRRRRNEDGARTHGEWRGGDDRGRAADEPGRSPARAAAADRHPSRLRAWRLRCLHGADRRRAGARLHRARGIARRRRRAHPRRDGRRSRHGGDQGCLSPGARTAVRLLHARHADHDLGPDQDQSQRRRARGQDRDQRQPLPLHRLSGHRALDPARGTRIARHASCKAEKNTSARRKPKPNRTTPSLSNARSHRCDRFHRQWDCWQSP